jgi:AAA15 family ATPase/GTPase
LATKSIFRGALSAILLSMTDQSGGIILIDEIENGFYYKRFPMMWEMILKFARQYDCQVFASTHSAECLNSAARIAEWAGDEFSLMRTVLEGGATSVRTFSGGRFSDAVLANIEVR